MRTPFEILGVAENATDDEIKKSYRKLAMQWHPDRNPDNKEAEENFKNIKEAFEQIQNEVKRSEWHVSQRRGHNSSTRNSYAKNNQFEDVFADLFKEFNIHPQDKEFRDFEGARKAAQARNSQAFAKNEDTQIEIAITLEEAFHGKEVSVTYRTLDGETRQVLLNIPAGIVEGKVVRCKTAGSRKHPELPSGDLLATIKIKPHLLYTREAQNLVMKVEVPALDMLVGGSARIVTIDGTSFDVNIRSCTKPGTRIRIPDYGMRVMGSRLRGDMFIELNVVWPDSLDTEVLNHLKAARDLTLPKTV
jgi:curved DNA-binding protein